jgi:hypothetical protein
MTGLAIIAGVLLTAGLTMAPARAAVTSPVKIHTAAPRTLKTCKTGANNTYEYWGWCTGTGPTSYRTIAYCNNAYGTLGVERWDGDSRQSYADCQIDGNNWLLTEDWGYLLCSNNNGAGTYQGYVDRHGDVSFLLLEYGNGNISTGGTTLCELDTSGQTWFNPLVPPTRPSS